MIKPKTKKIASIVANALLYVFLFACVVAVFLTVVSKQENDGAVEIFGYQVMTVTTGSMDASSVDVSGFEIKSIPKGSVIVVECVPYGDAEADKWYEGLKIGDVLTFKYLYPNQITITHRITNIEECEEGGYKIELQGDNVEGGVQTIYTSDKAENYEPLNYVIGKVKANSYAAGLVIGLLKSPISLVAIIVACFVIIVLEVVKIINTLHSENKQKIITERNMKDAEILELRRKLEALEKNETNTQENEGDKSENSDS